MTHRVAVVGGGVSGLTAAYEVRRAFGADAVVTVYEPAEVPGGLLCTREVGDTWMDVGAEAFLVRRPEAVDLVRELGLAGDVVSPGPLRPAIWSGDRLHPLPMPAIMGIPGSGAVLGALVDAADRARVDDEARRTLAWTPGAPISVGALVRERFGEAVLARSVDPMLGGVYSARADDLGLVETVPALAAALDRGAPSLSAAITELTSGPAVDGPVFGALRGGYRQLVSALVAASGARFIASAVESVAAEAAGLAVVTEGRVAHYDAVIVAVPPWQAAPVLADSAPAASRVLEAVQPAGSAVVGCVLAPGSVLPEHSGILVASDAGMRSKAVTLSSQKWPHLAESGPPVLRVSFGRLGEPVAVDDETLCAWAADDLAVYFTAAGLPAPVIESATVQRWPAGLPQYGPGHLAAMTTAVEALPARIALAGATVSGVGVPACIGAARRAARSVVTQL